MLLSRKRNFLFIHIQKTAGSSLRVALQQAIPDLQPFQGTHDHAAWVRPHLLDEWPRLFKAAFVRNPWDRLVSWYSMIQEQSSAAYRLWQYVRERSRTFEEFLLHCTDVIDDHDGRKSFLYNQLDYIADEQGNLLVDFVGRFERLDDDTARLFKRLGLDSVPLGRANASQHAHYSTYYTPATRDLVAERFQRDIAYFGYNFEQA